MRLLTKIGNSELTACIRRASSITTRSIEMHNTDQHHTAHILHLKDLYEQAEHKRMITALTQHRHAKVHAAGKRLGVFLVTLGTWLVRWNDFAAPEAQPQSGAQSRQGALTLVCCDSA